MIPTTELLSLERLMTIQVRGKCVICDDDITTKRPTYTCSPECAGVRTNQLKRHATAARLAKPVRCATAECLERFVRSNTTHRYCPAHAKSRRLASVRRSQVRARKPKK